MTGDTLTVQWWSGSFRHRGLKALYEGRTARRVAPEHERKLRDILAALDQSGGPAGMDLPGFRLHALSGTMKGYFAVTDVDYTDYH